MASTKRMKTVVSTMASADKKLEKELLEAGNKLLNPPSSVENLIRLLCLVGNRLSKVEQSPSKSMIEAFSPSMRALISDKLIKHSDIGVKVALASCLSELTRIAAPGAPYTENQMKEVLKLIVSSFENLHDTTSRWYETRIGILETVANIRLCAVMLDLECAALILEMFHLFLKTIREHHPENVFSSMETIMANVFEDSEDISLDLLRSILDCVKEDNKVVSPIARNLAESVLQRCASRLIIPICGML